MIDLTKTEEADIPLMVREVLRDMGLRPDAELHGTPRAHKQQMVLDGLEFLELFGERRAHSCEEIGIYCGCSWVNIALYERAAMNKLRAFRPRGMFGIETLGSDASRVRRDKFCHGNC